MNSGTLVRLPPDSDGAIAGTSGATHLNLSGDYSYMSQGYYDSLDAELQGLDVLPTTADALDAYIVPVAMEKAKLHDLGTPGYDIVTDKLPKLPVLAYAVNPFSSKFELITEGDDIVAKLRALTMTGKYATICQRLPQDYRIDVMRAILGQSLVEEYAGLARRVFEVFRLPLMRVRVIVSTTEYLLSAIEPLPYEELTLNEKKLLAGLGAWQK
ncbi:MAG TPA: RimK-like ATPgrasp N-terminal domain-containing protein [Trueperaceae bacterium]